MVSPGANRPDDLFRFCGGEDELDVWRGSSTSFSKALKPCGVTMWASSMM